MRIPSLFLVSRSQTQFGNAFHDAPRHTFKKEAYLSLFIDYTTQSVGEGIPKLSLGTRNPFIPLIRCTKY